MESEIQILASYAPAIVLHMLRAGAFLSLVPTFGAESSSKMLRVILSISLGAIMWSVDGQIVKTPDHMLTLGLFAAREILIGVLAGFAVRTMIVMLGIAGELISHEMGFSMARVMDPETGSSSTAMAQLFEVMGFMLIFQLDLHHEMLRVLRSTYQFAPVGQPFNFGLVYERLSVMVTQSLDFGLQYAAPVFGVMILLTVTLVVLSRAVQNINLMEFAFGIRILVAFLAAIYFLVEGTPFVERVFDTILTNAHGLFRGA